MTENIMTNIQEEDLQPPKIIRSKHIGIHTELVLKGNGYQEEEKKVTIKSVLLMKKVKVRLKISQMFSDSVL